MLLNLLEIATISKLWKCTMTTIIVTNCDIGKCLKTWHEKNIFIIFHILYLMF